MIDVLYLKSTKNRAKLLKLNNISTYKILQYTKIKYIFKHNMEI